MYLSLTVCLLGLLAPATLGQPGVGVQYFPDNPTIADITDEYDMTHPTVVEAIEFGNKYIVEQMVEVIPNKTYQAIAYNMGYTTVVVLDDNTLMVIDVPEQEDIFKETIARFRNYPAIGNKSVSALVTTVRHGDHDGSICTILRDPHNTDPVTIYQHEYMRKADKQHYLVRSPRGSRQFGNHIPDNIFLHHLVVKRIRDKKSTCPEIARNYKYISFDDDLNEVSISVGGTDLRFISIPGYTLDQMMMYIPSLRLLYATDLYYLSFPNVYTPRGEMERAISMRQWIQDTRRAARYPDVDIAVFTHAFPIYGADNVGETLTNRADGMQYVYDQSMRQINKGKTDDFAKSIRLPAEQRARVYLKDYYGVVETTAKVVNTIHFGWFSGEVEEMFPVTRSERRQQWIDYLGENQILVLAAKAYENGNYAWALELASIVFQENRSNRHAKELRTLCNFRMAELQTSMATRNYYLTFVLEDWDFVTFDFDMRAPIPQLDMDLVFRLLQSLVKAEDLEADGNYRSTFFLDIDSGLFQLDLRNGILDYQQVDSIPNDVLALHTTDADFKTYLTTGPLAGTVTGGTAANVTAFFDYIE